MIAAALALVGACAAGVVGHHRTRLHRARCAAARRPIANRYATPTWSTLDQVRRF